MRWTVPSDRLVTAASRLHLSGEVYVHGEDHTVLTCIQGFTGTRVQMTDVAPPATPFAISAFSVSSMLTSLRRRDHPTLSIAMDEPEVPRWHNANVEFENPAGGPPYAYGLTLKTLAAEPFLDAFDGTGQIGSITMPADVLRRACQVVGARTQRHGHTAAGLWINESGVWAASPFRLQMHALCVTGWHFDVPRSPGSEPVTLGVRSGPAVGLQRTLTQRGAVTLTIHRWADDATLLRLQSGHKTDTTFVTAIDPSPPGFALAGEAEAVATLHREELLDALRSFKGTARHDLLLSPRDNGVMVGRQLAHPDKTTRAKDRAITVRGTTAVAMRLPMTDLRIMLDQAPSEGRFVTLHRYRMTNANGRLETGVVMRFTTDKAAFQYQAATVPPPARPEGS